MSGQHGILIADKPQGPTSHDVVAGARRLYRTRAVGHAGTLDPMATGVILLLFGEATKLSNHLAGQHKRYRASIRFGRSTDTLDADGKVDHACELPTGWLQPAALADALVAERERTQQVPPAFSALKIDGRRAHRLSRAGKSVQLEPRAVQVQELALVEARSTEVTVELIVSKGYYVRALARDLGRRLGAPAHLSALRRLASGCFTVEEAIRWPPPEPEPLLPLARAACRALPSARLTERGAQRARQGQRLGPQDFVGDPRGADDGAGGPAAPMAWFDASGCLVAVGAQRDASTFVVVRGFRDPPQS